MANGAVGGPGGGGGGGAAETLVSLEDASDSEISERVDAMRLSSRFWCWKAAGRGLSVMVSHSSF